MNLSIVGSGYVGLCTAAGFLKKGHKVVCIDIDEKKVTKISEGTVPFHEPGIEEVLRDHKKSFTATTNYDALKDTDVTFICVGTPSGEDGSLDTTFVESAAQSIATALEGKDYHTVVVKSTVLPGTTENLTEKIFNKESVGIAANPEFLREGRALQDFLKPDRIVIGSNNKKALDILESLYKDFSAPVIRTDIKTAEMIKYASNAMLATRISFANEIGNICKKLGIDTYDVMHAVGMDPRIGSEFLRAGSGFGGSCFPKDISALAAKGKGLGLDMDLLSSVLSVNKKQKTHILNLLKERVPDLSGKRIAVLGLAFNPGTDDVRDSVAIDVIKSLKENGAVITVYDPMAMDNMKKMFPDIEYADSSKSCLKNTDACLILTDWKEFKDLKNEDFDVMNSRVIIEGRKVLKEIEGSEGICW